MPDRYLTTDQLVQRWEGAVARNTIVNWRGRGEGPPYVKIGHKVLYKLADIEAWEARNTTNHHEREPEPAA